MAELRWAGECRRHSPKSSNAQRYAPILALPYFPLRLRATGDRSHTRRRYVQYLRISFSAWISLISIALCDIMSTYQTSDMPTIRVPPQKGVSAETMVALPRRLEIDGKVTASISGSGEGIRVQVNDTSETVIRQLISTLHSAGIREVADIGDEIMSIEHDEAREQRLPARDESIELRDKINSVLQR